MMGSDADFGGRKDYFEFHGDYTIYDYFYAIEEKNNPFFSKTNSIESLKNTKE